MSTESRAAFAKRCRVNRSTVTRWAEAGRLVLDGGDVMVEESLARLRQTSGGRDDVAARHAANRGEDIPEATAGEGNAPAGREAGRAPTATAATPAPLTAGESRADALARKESAAADLLEIELAQKRGTLIPKEDVDAALKAFAAATRARLDVLADQLAPIVAPVTDLGEVHALMAENHRQTLAGIADDMQRAEAALGQGAA